MPREYQHRQTTDPASPRRAGLTRLEDLDGYDVADGFPDPRGWDVKARDGRTVGEVKSLLVDRSAMAVRYLEVELAEELAGRGRDRCVHVPVGVARLDGDRDDVLLDLDAAGVAALGAADLTTAPDAGDPRFDGAAFFGRRAAGRDQERHITLHEERLDLGARAVRAGEVTVRKTVETERVHESVPVRHEEVTVERRPIAAGALPGDDAKIGEDSITVPLMAEKVVTEKRVVPVEEVVVRKTARTEEQVVDDTVRRERVDVERTAGDEPAQPDRPRGDEPRW